MIASFPRSARPRTAMVALAVLLFHGLALWALQGGLLRRMAEVVVPVHMLGELVEPPRPVPPPPPPVPRPIPLRTAKVLPATVPALPLMQPLATHPDPQPAADAPTAIATAPAPLSPSALPAAVVPAAVAAAQAEPKPMPPAVEWPNSDADYLQNPKPVYPPMSKRLNEQGTVQVRVLIGADGTASKAEVQQSSGYFRLDDAAVATVLKWRYVPGKRAGKPEAMWFTVPIAWVLR